MRPVLTHLVVPVLLGVGMALAYLGAFHAADPHGVRVDVVGTSAQVRVLASDVADALGDSASVRTVPDEAAARRALERQEVAGAYVPDATHPRLLIASAASDTTAIAVERMLSPIALRAGQPLQVVDVAPTPASDSTGQGAFFYLVALTVGGYSSSIAIGAAGARLLMRVRAALAVGTAAVLTIAVTAIAGPLYGALPSHVVQVGLLAWAYTTAVVLVGVGLHPLLGRFTTGVVVALFVMLNFTSAGGVFAPALQPGFFGALHGFWIGAGLLEGARRLLYFPALGIGDQVLRLLLWVAAGALLVALGGAVERRRARSAAPPVRSAGSAPVAGATRLPDPAALGESAEEEIEEVVPA